MAALVPSVIALIKPRKANVAVKPSKIVPGLDGLIEKDSRTNQIMLAVIIFAAIFIIVVTYFAFRIIFTLYQ